MRPSIAVEGLAKGEKMFVNIERKDTTRSVVLTGGQLVCLHCLMGGRRPPKYLIGGDYQWAKENRMEFVYHPRVEWFLKINSIEVNDE